MAYLIIFIWFSMLLSLTYSQTQKQEVTPAQGATSHWFALLIEDEATVASADFQSFKKGTGAQSEVFSYATLQTREEGTTKENVSCEIHDANFMDCKWTVRKTPGDIHYQFFYSQSPRTFVGRECRNYKTESEGRHVRCHFDNLSEFPNPYPYHFLVTGTSNGREVQCTDDNISLWDIEIFKPPNVTIYCKDLNCSLQWQTPKTIQLEKKNFDYQLQIQKIDDKNRSPVVLNIDKITRYNYKINYGKYTVKIRTKKKYGNKNWSTWSETQEFAGHEVHKDNLLPVLMVLLPGITFIIVLIVGYLCKRYYVIQKIFPPIPQIRDQVSDSFQKYVEVDWKENKMLPEQCKIEEIQIT
ncbi:interleukin-3 receptor subunit alpha isoform X3 [Sarcophilus harrisii]|uniref:Interleukin 3 receptor subunit alpha n=1 Tax=Sarcophilus harrisii TaxID=9305 RepID=A0A7N4PD71_SARHA|nr:interleukin-3 receptor subunit alpha isoform X3 [Sarcophilus harrisii]